MNNKNEVVMATSIAPVGIEKQKIAIQTWIDLGFSVVSLNIQPEIEKLDSQFPEVHFYQVDRDGRQQYGKPFVYVNDVLQYLQEYGSKIVGIVNSDIHLRAGVNFISYIQEQAHNSVVFASRIDIDTPQSIEGEMYGYGFDLFFFDRNLLNHFPSCDAFCLGIPWWDYWVPLIALQKQLNPKYLQNTVAYHVKHDINYSLKNWREVGIVFADFFIPDMAQKMRSILESGELEELDEELGPNLTYEFIQMMYQNSNLVTYKSSSQQISKLIESLSDFNLSDRMKLIHLHNQNIDPYRIDIELQYEYLIWLAWSSYCNNEWINMTRYLAESLRYNSDPKAKIIVNWIELFQEFSQDQKKPFDAYTLGQSPEWQQLIVSILL